MALNRPPALPCRRTINRFGEEVDMITKGRRRSLCRYCAVPIAEAMLAIV
ncbi:hypothetical protein ACULNC_06635 [Shigella flexneri]